MKVSPKEQAEALRKLRSWIAESGATLTKVEKPPPGAAHHLTFVFPPQGPTTINLVRPEGRGLTVLISGTTVSPEHLKTLQAASSETRQQVILALRRVAFQGGVVGFAPNIQGEVVTNWNLDVEIYDDGLSQQSLFLALRALLSKHLELIDSFNEALGARLTGGSEGATSTAGYIR